MHTWRTPAPLYRDPVYDGCADPTVIYNRQEDSWWMFYTQRRASLPVVGVSGSHGTQIGIASSHDGGTTWVYRGTAEGLRIDRGQNTFWAPEVLWDATAACYRMVVTYVQGVPSTWDTSHGRSGLALFTSDDLWDWRFEGFLGGKDRSACIDACAHPLPDGSWRLWYWDTHRGCAIYAVDTVDFESFSDPALAVEGRAEGPNVFALGGFGWMLTDPLGKRQGLAVYRSLDFTTWEYQGLLLDSSGIRPLDDSKGRHADVLPHGDDATIFYFTQPYKNYDIPQDMTATQDRQAICVIQCARLHVKGDQLELERNEDFALALRPQ